MVNAIAALTIWELFSLFLLLNRTGIKSHDWIDGAKADDTGECEYTTEDNKHKAEGTGDNAHVIENAKYGCK